MPKPTYRLSSDGYKALVFLHYRSEPIEIAEIARKVGLELRLLVAVVIPELLHKGMILEAPIGSYAASSLGAAFIDNTPTRADIVRGPMQTAGVFKADPALPPMAPSLRTRRLPRRKKT